ncbi:hypothetical protein [Brevundimonas naejangsanensis]|uniref:hypothetical protein n=1 Tax=Brevundimonas naejangsanensis TaxID=588932 RepID=UPI001F096132|nr:hypothetical protein [Brevundimonas naejangsanensis]
MMVTSSRNFFSARALLPSKVTWLMIGFSRSRRSGRRLAWSPIWTSANRPVRDRVRTATSMVTAVDGVAGLDRQIGQDRGLVDALVAPHHDAVDQGALGLGRQLHLGGLGRILGLGSGLGRGRLLGQGRLSQSGGEDQGQGADPRMRPGVWIMRRLSF